MRHRTPFVAFSWFRFFWFCCCRCSLLTVDCRQFINCLMRPRQCRKSVPVLRSGRRASASTTRNGQAPADAGMRMPTKHSSPPTPGRRSLGSVLWNDGLRCRRRLGHRGFLERLLCFLLFLFQLALPFFVLIVGFHT